MRETKKPELKKITQEELNEKLAEYVRWRDKSPLNNERYDELSQLDLRGLSFPQEIDLRGVNFSGSNLTGVDLTRANLSDANLSEADLTGAKLSGAVFPEATLIGTNFSRANLSSANLAWADLTGADFSNATLTDAKFCSPPSHGDPDKVEGGATLVGTKFLNAIMHGADLRETKTAGMQLGGADVTNAKLPDEIKSFEGLKTVEEASKIAKRLFTMLLTALGFSALTIFSTKDHLLLTNSTTSPLPIIQTPIPLAGFYWVAPFLLSAFFIYFLLNLLHLYKLISKLPAVFPDGTPLDEKIFPWQLNTLVREHFHVLSEPKIPLFRLRKFLMVFLAWWTTPIVLFGFWLRYLPRHDHFGSWLHIVWIGLIIIGIIVTYRKALQILKNDPTYEWSLKRIDTFLLSVFLVALIGFPIGVSTVITFFPQCEKFNSQKWLNANFAEQEVSHKSDNWNPEKPIQGVKGASLENADLNYADARGAFLVKAKLKGAWLNHADFTDADLTGADLSGAHLDEAKFIGAKLTDANLTGVDHGLPIIVKAAIPEQIKKIKNWQLAFYDRDFNEKQLKLSDRDISNALDAFIRAENPTLSNEEVGKLYEKEMRGYRIHYGWPTGDKAK